MLAGRASPGCWCGSRSNTSTCWSPQIEDIQREARQKIRKEQQAARERSINLAAAAAAKAAEEALDAGRDPFAAPGFNAMPMPATYGMQPVRSVCIDAPCCRHELIVSRAHADDGFADGGSSIPPDAVFLRAATFSRCSSVWHAANQLNVRAQCCVAVLACGCCVWHVCVCVNGVAVSRVAVWGVFQQRNTGSGAVACGMTPCVGVLLCRYGAPPAGGQVYPQTARSSSALQSAGQSAFRTSSFSAAGDRGMHRTPSAGGRPAEGEASAWSAVC